jgi:uncharacterized membrane protein YbhN (UPF0104 family)
MQKFQNRILAGLVIALLIYVVLLLVLDNQGQVTTEMAAAFAGYPWSWLVLVAALHVLAGVFRFLEWQYFLGVIGARRLISVADSAIIMTFGFTMVVSPGKAAELLKAVFLKIKTGVPVSRSAPVILAERVVDGLAVITILTLVLLTAGDRLNLGEFLPTAQTIIVASAALIGFGLIVVQIRPLAAFFLNVLAHLPLIKRAHGWFTELYESSREIFSLRHVIPTVFIGVGVYLSSGFGLIAVLMSFGIDVGLTEALQALFIVGISAAIGALSFVPNGAGVTEVTGAALLMGIMAPNHPELTLGMAAAIALLDGFFHKWFRVVVGLVVGVIFRKRLFTSGLQQEIAGAGSYRTTAASFETGD